MDGCYLGGGGVSDRGIIGDREQYVDVVTSHVGGMV